MNRGPQANNRVAGPTFEDKAVLAWPDPVPSWVMALAGNADAHGLKGAGELIGYSTAAISTVISGKYAGDLGRVEEMVNATLLGETVDCPVLGSIGRLQCHAEQAKPIRATNSTSMRLFAACRNGCPNYRGARS